MVDRSSSPFSALSYDEQQLKWLEWRSRQLHYQKPQATEKEELSALPPLELPLQKPDKASSAVQTPLPYRHAELDRLYARHLAAARMTGDWHKTISAAAKNESKQ